MANPSTTPVTIQVIKAPLTSQFLVSQMLSADWSKWFATIGTWLFSSMEIKESDLYNGSVKVGHIFISRMGNIVFVNGYINSGNYDTIISGITVNPVTASNVMLCGDSVSNGILSTDGTMQIKLNSVKQILISSSYIAKIDNRGL